MTSDAAEMRLDQRDRSAREYAQDPLHNVALEASAGTGKTRVLVERYVRLLQAGVDPTNVVAITFTRKAAAEMRERIIARLRQAAATGEIAASRWRELRDRLGDIAISTIDAFCLSLLREFPLEADLDPGFGVADETEVPRLIAESLDRAIRICRGLAIEDDTVALVFAQLGDRRATRGLTSLLARRLVAPRSLARFVQGTPGTLTVESAVEAGATRLLDVLGAMPGGIDAFVESGLPDPTFLVLVRTLRELRAVTPTDPGRPALVQAAYARVTQHFLTQNGTPRKKLDYTKAEFVSEEAWRRHRDLVVAHAPAIKDAAAAFKRDLNVLVSRGVLRMYQVAQAEYRRTLDAHSVLDFPDLLIKAVDLLQRMEEFSRSRYRLESRYHHVLVDEFQDTSRPQWQLVQLLVQSWGEGAGLAASGPVPPSIFIVGDRKQSIYAFRDADVSVLADAASYMNGLRPESSVSRAISRSFRSVGPLLAFVNDVCAALDLLPHRRDAFRFDEQDRFPLAGGATALSADSLGLVTAETAEGCAALVADEIAALVRDQVPVRDPDTGVRRAVTLGDIAILFRSRESHREFEHALEGRGLATYVYKGLGFFDADETKDLMALLWYLAEPFSDRRTAAVLRSRFFAVSDDALQTLGRGLAAAVRHPDRASALAGGDAVAFGSAQAALARWRQWADLMPPAELLDAAIAESAYLAELRGPRFQQAHENVKKLRALIRRIQNRGYATVGRIAAQLERLSVGDESNAAIDARDAVRLMTVHAAKGLEFPVVFLVNLGKGIGGYRDPIRVTGDPDRGDIAVAVGEFRSAADDDDVLREREETKRLLYVGLTRARDRLYLSAMLKDGSLKIGRGSLAEVLPAALRSLFAVSATGASPVVWSSSSGATHTFRCLTEAPVDQPEGAERALEGGDGTPVMPAAVASVADDFGALVDHHATAHGLTVTPAPSPLSAVAQGADSDRLTGVLVHRLLQRLGLSVACDLATVRELAGRLVRPEDDGDGASGEAIERAATLFLSLSAREDVRRIYLSGRPFHEVPFTTMVEGVPVRGVVDCLVSHADGATILEFKTGRPRPEHQSQVEVYRRAMESALPGIPIDVALVYAQNMGT